MNTVAKRLVLVGGETLEDIDIFSIISPLPKVKGRMMNNEELAAFDAAYNEAQKPFYLEIMRDDALTLSHSVKPGDEVIAYNLDTKERIAYKLNAAKEGMFRFAMASGSSITAILRTLAAQDRTAKA